MQYRLPAIDIPDNNPFVNDALNRKSSVEFVASIVSETGGHPLVLAIDSPYGTGKSTFVEMLDKVLSEKNFQTVYFNAWKADHVSDPLIAMVAALDEAFPKPDPASGSDTMARVKKVATILLKRGAAVGVKIATAGVVELSDDIEEALGDSASDATSDVIEAFEKEEEAAKCFRTELKEVVASLPDMRKKPTLVFFIDELDRCRPDFAMSLLERIKHMFDVPNLAFVLSIDKKQLEAVTAAVYGERIDAAEYLRKFIDLEFGLPSPSRGEFIVSAIKRAGLDTVFSQRQHYELSTVVGITTTMADVYNMSLRAIERCVVRLKLVMAGTPQNRGLDSAHVALLIVLRSVDKEMFDRIVARTIDPMEAMEYFKSLPHVNDRLSGQEGFILEALLVADLWERHEIAAYRRGLMDILNRDHAVTPERSAAEMKLQLLDSYSSGPRSGGTIQKVAATIDIAANIRF